MFYKENNVFEEALERIRMLFDYHDDIIVSTIFRGNNGNQFKDND